MSTLISTEHTLANGNVVLRMNVSFWTASIKDKQTEAEVLADKQARSKSAFSGRKHLFADCPQMKNIQRIVGAARAWLGTQTAVWDDNGGRFCTAAMFMSPAFQERLAKFKDEFDTAVNDFLQHYDSLVTAQSFAMGTLFDRTEYPTRDQVQRKFAWNVCVEPVPVSGHFIADAAATGANVLATMLQQQNEERMQRIVEETRARLVSQVDSLIEKLRDGVRFHESTFEAATTLVDVISSLNITKDQHIEDARIALSRVLGEYGGSAVAVKEAIKDKATRTQMQTSLEQLRSSLF